MGDIKTRQKIVLIKKSERVFIFDVVDCLLCVRVTR